MVGVGETYGQGTLKRNVVLLNGANGLVGDGSLAVLQDRTDINGLPLDGGL